jgi:hypothetical protein
MPLEIMTGIGNTLIMLFLSFCIYYSGTTLIKFLTVIIDIVNDVRDQTRPIPRTLETIYAMSDDIKRVKTFQRRKIKKVLKNKHLSVNGISKRYTRN